MGNATQIRECEYHDLSLMPALSRNAILALVGETLVLHTTEEYLTFPAYLPPANRLPPLFPPPSLLQNPRNLHVGLIAATILPLAVIAWAILRPRKGLLVSGQCRLACLRSMGQGRIRSGGDHSGVD